MIGFGDREDSNMSVTPSIRSLSEGEGSKNAPMGTQGNFNPLISQEVKRRRRRESHNLVERRRRDNINERIQDISHLVPMHRLEDEKIRKALQSGVIPEQEDKGPNKGDILTGAVGWTRDLMWMLSLKLQQIENLEQVIQDLGGSSPFEIGENEKRMKSELVTAMIKNEAADLQYSRAPGTDLRVPNHTDIRGDPLINGGEIDRPANNGWVVAKSISNNVRGDPRDKTNTIDRPAKNNWYSSLDSRDQFILNERRMHDTMGSDYGSDDDSMNFFRSSRRGRTGSVQSHQRMRSMSRNRRHSDAYEVVEPNFSDVSCMLPASPPSQNSNQPLLDEKPNKCPVRDCEYHVIGFSRKFDRDRHILAHNKKGMRCGFCPSSDSTSTTFISPSAFKRHLTSSHDVEHVPPNSRKKNIGSINSENTLVADAPLVDCSICCATFSNAQIFYEHLDDCVRKSVYAAILLAELEKDQDPKLGSPFCDTELLDILREGADTPNQPSEPSTNDAEPSLPESTTKNAPETTSPSKPKHPRKIITQIILLLRNLLSATRSQLSSFLGSHLTAWFVLVCATAGTAITSTYSVSVPQPTPSEGDSNYYTNISSSIVSICSLYYLFLPFLRGEDAFPVRMLFYVVVAFGLAATVTGPLVYVRDWRRSVWCAFGSGVANVAATALLFENVGGERRKLVGR